MKNDLLNEEKTDKNSVTLSESYRKGARIGANVLCILAIGILIILLPVAISCFIEKDYSPAIIITIFLFVTEIPLFLLVYIFKKKPEKIIKPENSLKIHVNKKEYKEKNYTIIQELNKIYGVDKPYINYKVPAFYLGPEILVERVIVYDCGDYLHFITIGMSRLCEERGVRKFEYTFKLKKMNTSNFNLEIEWASGILQEISSLHYLSKKLIKDYEIIDYGHGSGIDSDNKSKITGIITIPDASLNSIDIQDEHVDFIELVGVTDMELKSIESNQLTVKELYEKIGADVTDYNRDSVI